MTDHPLVKQDIRQYMEKHQIEQGLNKALNVVLQTLPQDPFSSMAVSLIDSNESSPCLVKLMAHQTYVCEMSQVSIQIDVYLSHQGSERCYHKHIYSYNESEKESMTWDDEAMTDMEQACAIINEQVTELLQGKDLNTFKKIEDALKNFKVKKEEQGQKIGPNITNAVAQALYHAYGKAMSAAQPFESLFKANLMRDYNVEVEKLPKLMFTILNGGKEASSKIKFTKFYLILDVQPEDIKIFDILDVYYKLVAKIEEGVKATKVGLAGFKKGSPDGAYFNAFDNINECFKLLEDAIAAAGINTEEVKYLKIGINADAQNWFIEEGSKYEWDGPKNQMDTDQVIEFYQKMCTDHPLLDLIEDPFANTDIKGFKKFCAKLKQSNPDVKVSVLNLFESNLDIAKEYTQFIQEESDEEDEEANEETKEEGEGEAPPEEAAPEVVEEKKAPPKKGGKKGKDEAPEATEVEDDGKPDPNAFKFIPAAIHLKKEIQNTSSGVQQFANYSFTMKQDDAFGLIVEDNQVDGLSNDAVDFAFGSGAVAYLNLTGFGKPEKSCKVARFASILEYLSHE